MQTETRCTCRQQFRNGEDFRDHLPCPGSPEEREAYARGKRDTVKEILACFEIAIAGHRRLAREHPNNVAAHLPVDTIKADALDRFAEVYLR